MPKNHRTKLLCIKCRKEKSRSSKMALTSSSNNIPISYYHKNMKLMKSKHKRSLFKRNIKEKKFLLSAWHQCNK